MNILVSVNGAYIKPLKVMLYSLSYNTSAYDVIKTYLLYNSLNEEEVTEIKDFCCTKCNNMLLIPIKVSDSFNNFSLQDRFPVESFYRLFAPFLLPEDVKKIMWIDADIIIKGDIEEVYNLDTHGKAIMAIRDIGNATVVGESIERLGMSHNSIYVNSGVVIFDLEKIRRVWSLQSMTDYLFSIKERLLWPDQDAINLMFEGDKKVLPEKWNYQITYNYEITEEALNTSAVVHYIGPVKPWEIEYVPKQKYLYWEYERKCFGNRDYLNFRIKQVSRMLYKKFIRNNLSMLRRSIMKNSK